MPKLVASSGAVITAAPGAHHYRFIGLEIRPAPTSFSTTWSTSGERATGRWTRCRITSIVDRCYLHGDPRRGARRGIALNSRQPR